MNNYNYKLLYLLLFVPITGLASEAAVEKTNFALGASYGSSSIFNDYMLSGTATFPLTSNMGAQFLAAHADVDGRRYGNTRGIGGKSNLLYSQIFLRDPATGTLGLAYGFGRSKSDDRSDPDRTTDSDTYTIFGEYYLDRFRFAASRIHSKIDAGFEQYISFVSAAWYVQDNTSLELTRSRYEKEYTDYAKITHQPRGFNNLALSVKYESNQWGGTLDTITVAISYFFDTRVSLIDRDRKFRFNDGLF